jgi:hypothetical protein
MNLLKRRDAWGGAGRGGRRRRKGGDEWVEGAWEEGGVGEGEETVGKGKRMRTIRGR